MQDRETLEHEMSDEQKQRGSRLDQPSEPHSNAPKEHEMSGVQDTVQQQRKPQGKEVAKQRGKMQEGEEQEGEEQEAEEHETSVNGSQNPNILAEQAKFFEVQYDRSSKITT
jgi:hypothetical protein